MVVVSTSIMAFSTNVRVVLSTLNGDTALIDLMTIIKLCLFTQGKQAQLVVLEIKRMTTDTEIVGTRPDCVICFLASFLAAAIFICLIWWFWVVFILIFSLTLITQIAVTLLTLILTQVITNNLPNLIVENGRCLEQG